MVDESSDSWEAPLDDSKQALPSLIKHLFSQDLV